MIVKRIKYLVKCEMPGCKNVACNMYSAGVDLAEGITLCDKCIKDLYDKIKVKTNYKGVKNEK